MYPEHGAGRVGQPPWVVTAITSKIWNRPTTLVGEHEDHDRTQERQGDQPEHGELRRPVQPRGLVEVLGDRLEAGVEQQGGEADMAPDGDAGDRDVAWSGEDRNGCGQAPIADRKALVMPISGSSIRSQTSPATTFENKVGRDDAATTTDLASPVGAC